MPPGTCEDSRSSRIPPSSTLLQQSQSKYCWLTLLFLQSAQERSERNFFLWLSARGKEYKMCKYCGKLKDTLAGHEVVCVRSVLRLLYLNSSEGLFLIISLMND